MSQRLIKPGLYPAQHSKAGTPIEPLYVRKDGSAVWPVLGGSDDPDDPSFTGGGNDGGDPVDDDEDEEDDNDEPKDKSKKKNKKKSDDDDEDDDPEGKGRASRQAARYRTQLREEQKRRAELENRLRAIEDKDKKPDEIATRDLTEARARVDDLTATVAELRLENAWLQANTVEWVDRDDALAAAQRLGLLDDVIESDGTVDTKALRAALRELSRKKPHLVKKKASTGRASADSDDENEDDDDQGPSAPQMNGKRKGARSGSDRAALSKRFPVLGRRR